MLAELAGSFAIIPAVLNEGTIISSIGAVPEVGGRVVVVVVTGGSVVVVGAAVVVVGAKVVVVAGGKVEVVVEEQRALQVWLVAGLVPQKESETVTLPFFLQTTVRYWVP